MTVWCFIEYLGRQFVGVVVTYAQHGIFIFADMTLQGYASWTTQFALSAKLNEIIQDYISNDSVGTKLSKIL